MKSAVKRISLTVNTLSSVVNKLSFDENAHTYYYSNEEMRLSVTELVGEYLCNLHVDFEMENVVGEIY